MRYKCLIFDHDDTTVNSTATIHYPCFIKYIEKYRPGMTLSLDEYFRKNFTPGFIEMCIEDYHMSERELIEEVEFWKEYVKDHIPDAYPGIREIMERQKRDGGYIAVISHSMKDNILRDYAYNNLPMPDVIYGWEQPPERRKPNVWPAIQVLSDLGLDKKDALMIDDLKPGYDMAIDAGIDFAAAGWAHNIPEIEQFMRANCNCYFKTVEELGSFLNG